MVKYKKILERIILLIFVIVIAKMIDNSQYHVRSAATNAEKGYAVYYLLNIDGMKGLGHSALMLTDEDGKGLLYSYNGMQYSLAHSLGD